MTNQTRRTKLMDILKSSTGPRTGAELSECLGVTRQVVVADVALLRAAGEQIIATPQGYLLNKLTPEGVYTRTIVSKHSSDPAEIRDELYAIVDNGGVIRDVTVEHPLYGQITAILHVESRRDVDLFIEKLRQTKAEPLLVLTDGWHLHTIEAKNEATMHHILEILRSRNYSPCE